MKTSRQMETEIGYRLAQLRLSRNVTQSMLARDSGIGLRTLRRLEVGEPSTLDTFLRVVLALDLGDAILGAVPTGQVRPIERVSRAGAQRRRARPRPRKDLDPAWTWGDDPDD
ncbi:MAG: helix-turn-helix transcriptional regulator [Alphaproteobacteria bacterium]|nr:helix-turn-helix transcriptional regulator [Alphaproteobacteria bacterium]